MLIKLVFVLLVSVNVCEAQVFALEHYDEPQLSIDDNDQIEGSGESFAPDSPNEPRALPALTENEIEEKDQIQRECPSIMDVVFMLDSSGSAKRTFHNDLQWTRDLIETLPVDKDQVRVSVVQYAGFPFTEFALSTYPTQSNVLEHLVGVQFRSGVTRTGAALRRGQIELFRDDRGGRANAAKIMVLFTDGLSSDNPLAIAEQLQELGVKIYVVVQAPDAYLPEVYAIAGNELNVFTADEHDELIETLLSQAELSRQCEQPSEDQLARAAALFGNLELSSGEYLKLLQYDEDAQEIYDRDDDQLIPTNDGGEKTDEVDQELEFIPEFMKAQPSTFTTQPTTTTPRRVTTTRRPAPTTTRRVTTTRRPAPTTRRIPRTQPPRVRATTRRPLRTTPRRRITPRTVFNRRRASSNTDTNTKLTPKRLTRLKPSELLNNNVNPDGCPVDFLIVLDSSGSVQNEYQNQKDFVSELFEHLPMDNQRVALIQFAGKNLQKTEFTFEYRTLLGVRTEFQKVRHFTGTTHLGKALSHARNLLNQGRPEADTYLIVVSDGFAHDDVAGPAEQIRRTLPNVHVFAIGLADENQRDVLLAVTGSEDNVFIGRQANTFFNVIDSDMRQCPARLRARRA